MTDDKTGWVIFDRKSGIRRSIKTKKCGYLLPFEARSRKDAVVAWALRCLDARLLSRRQYASILNRKVKRQ